MTLQARFVLVTTVLLEKIACAAETIAYCLAHTTSYLQKGLFQLLYRDSSANPCMWPSLDPEAFNEVKRNEILTKNMQIKRFHSRSDNRSSICTLNPIFVLKQNPI